MDRAKIISSCRPKFWRDKQRNHHKIRPAYVQLGLTAEQKTVRLAKFKRDVLLKNWEIRWIRENLPELIEISRSLAKKTTVAANVFYAAFGLILFFLLRLSDAGATVEHSITNRAIFVNYPTLSNEYSAQAPAQPLMDVHIDGLVTNEYNNNPIPQAKVVLIKSDGERYDSTYTDTNGNYNLDFIWTHSPVSPVDSNRIHPNPYGSITNILFDAKETGNYNMDAYTTDGKKALEESTQLNAGMNEINVSGGDAGLKVIVIYNKEQKQVYKAIQTENTHKPISHNIKQTETPQFKSTQDEPLNLGDLVTVEFSKQGYYTSSTSDYIQPTMTINKQLEPEPNVDLWAYGYSILEGEPVVDNTAIKIKWADNSTDVFYAEDGLIHITKYLDPFNPNVFISNADTTFYQEWIYGVKREDPYATTKELNLFQSQKVVTPAGQSYVFPTPAPADLTLLPDTIDVYFVPNWVSDGIGLQYNTRGEVFRTVVRGDGPPDLTKKWEYVTQVADTIFWYEMQVLNGSLTPITEEERLKQKAAMDSTEVNMSELKHNGRKLIPPHKRVPIYTKTEPEWLEGQVRNWDQIYKFGYDTINGNNNNNGYTTNFTFSDYPRLKNGTAGYLRDSNMTYKIEELFGAFVDSSDPPVGNLGGLIVTATGSMTTFGKAVRGMMLGGDPGSIYW